MTEVEIYKKALEDISNIGEWRSLNGDACDIYKMACDALADAERAQKEEADANQIVGWLYKGIEYHTKGKLNFYEKRVKKFDESWWEELGPVVILAAAKDKP